jgi:hypothetical protein
MHRCRSGGRAAPRTWSRAPVVTLVVTGLALGLVSCASHRAPTAAPRWHDAVKLAAVQPLPPGCSVTNSCAPPAASDVALSLAPGGYADQSGLEQQPEDNGVLLSRRWQSPVNNFLDPGGEPMGAQVAVRLIEHPAESASDALGLSDNPRATSPVGIGSRIAYESDWTVPAQSLDGSPVQLSASSVYVVISSTVTLEVTSIGLTPSLTQILTRGVVVQ